MKKLIYAADDDQYIRDLLRIYFSEAGYAATIFENGDDLFEAFQNRSSDIVILDIMMPGSDGFSICKKIREISKVPIVLLTAKDTELDYENGYVYGADDYIIKPFKPSVMIMRINALFRRQEMEKYKPEENISFGDISFSSYEHTIFFQNKKLKLTITETSLITYMLYNNNKAIKREEFLREVWGIVQDIETRVVDETIRKVRKKLKEAGSKTIITSIWGLGYKLEYHE